MSFTSVTLTGTVTLQPGIPAPGAVLALTLTAPISDGVTIIEPTPLYVRCDATGNFSVVVPANNDLTTTPVNTAYLVSITYGTSVIDNFAVQVPYTNAPVDLFSLPRIGVGSLPEPTYGVASLQGLTGAVELASPDGSVSILVSGKTIEMEAAGGGSGTLTSVTAADDTIIADTTGASVTIAVAPMIFDNWGSASVAQDNAETYAFDITQSASVASEAYALTQAQGASVNAVAISEVYAFGLTQSASVAVESYALAQAQNASVNAVTVAESNAAVTYLPLIGGTVTGPIVLPGSPVAPFQAADKLYVDSVATGLSPKSSVAALAAASITLAGTQSIDGYSASVGDRILCIAQATSIPNGIWVVASGSWTRPSDFASGSEQIGTYTLVENGTAYKGSGWVLTGGEVDVDTSPQTWVQFTAANTLTAGTGLTLTGTVMNIANEGPGAVGPIGGAASVAIVSTNAQGQVSALSAALIQIAESQVTSLTTDLTAASVYGLTQAQNASVNAVLVSEDYALSQAQSASVNAVSVAEGNAAATYLPLAGGSVTGVVTMPTNVVASDASQQVATDAFVQAAIVNSLKTKPFYDATAYGIVSNGADYGASINTLKRQVSALGGGVVLLPPGLISGSVPLVKQHGVELWGQSQLNSGYELLPNSRCQIMQTQCYWPVAAAYSNITNYSPGQYIYDAGICYVCISETIGNAPPNATYWTVDSTHIGVWTATTTFVMGDVCAQGGYYWYCELGHISGASFTGEGLYWRQISPQPTVYSNVVTYNLGDLVDAGNACYINSSLTGSTGNAPPSPEWTQYYGATFTGLMNLQLHGGWYYNQTLSGTYGDFNVGHNHCTPLAASDVNAWAMNVIVMASTGEAWYTTGNRYANVNSPTDAPYKHCSSNAIKYVNCLGQHCGGTAWVPGADTELVNCDGVYANMAGHRFTSQSTRATGKSCNNGRTPLFMAYNVAGAPSATGAADATSIALTGVALSGVTAGDLINQGIYDGATPTTAGNQIPPNTYIVDATAFNAAASTATVILSNPVGASGLSNTAVTIGGYYWAPLGAGINTPTAISMVDGGLYVLIVAAQYGLSLDPHFDTTNWMHVRGGSVLENDRGMGVWVGGKNARELRIDIDCQNNLWGACAVGLTGKSPKFSADAIIDITSYNPVCNPQTGRFLAALPSVPPNTGNPYILGMSYTSGLNIRLNSVNDSINGSLGTPVCQLQGGSSITTSIVHIVSDLNEAVTGGTAWASTAANDNVLLINGAIIMGGTLTAGGLSPVTGLVVSTGNFTVDSSGDGAFAGTLTVGGSSLARVIGTYDTGSILIAVPTTTLIALPATGLYRLTWNDKQVTANSGGGGGGVTVGPVTIGYTDPDANNGAGATALWTDGNSNGTQFWNGNTLLTTGQLTGSYTFYGKIGTNVTIAELYETTAGTAGHHRLRTTLERLL